MITTMANLYWHNATRYPCHWGGCVDGKPMVAGLEEFGARVLNTLANAITKLCPEEV